MTAAGLGRFRAPPTTRNKPVAGTVCEMCGVPIAGEHEPGNGHGHVANTENRQIMCTCRGCWLLFTHSGAGKGKYRAVPDRYRYAPSFALDDALWADLAIPVKMAFFFVNAEQERWVAFYPSPAGATESLLSLDSWADVLAANPAFADVEPDVEALLLLRGSGGFECFGVPIDSCYELVGLVKLHWRGFDGGEQAWKEIDGFFDRLRERGKRVGTDG
jgi:hypothetical protein